MLARATVIGTLWSAWSEILTERSACWCPILATGLTPEECSLDWRAEYGYEQIGQGRLTNDALIAMSAARLGIRVITTNERDFRRLAEFRTFQWQVTAV